MIDANQKTETGVIEVGDYARIKCGSAFYGKLYGKHHRFELLSYHVAVVTKIGKKWIHFKILHPRIKKSMRKVLMPYDGDFRVLKEA